MNPTHARITHFLLDEEGASASEYAILVAVLAAIIFLAVKQFDINGIFSSAGNKVKGCVSANGSSC